MLSTRNITLSKSARWGVLYNPNKNMPRSKTENQTNTRLWQTVGSWMSGATKIPYVKPTWVHVSPRNTKIDRQITSWSTSSWWFQPQKCSSNSISFPQEVENKTYLNPPNRWCLSGDLLCPRLPNLPNTLGFGGIWTPKNIPKRRFGSKKATTHPWSTPFGNPPTQLWKDSRLTTYW